MAVTVADLVKFYADAPPPKKDSLADLQARLEALSTPGYQSPFKFDSSTGVGPFRTSGYGTVGNFRASVMEVSSARPAPPRGEEGTGKQRRGRSARTPSLSELFEQRTGASSRPLWEQLAERRGPAPLPAGLGKFLYDGGNALGQVIETLRPQLEKFGVFVGNLAAGLENTLNALRTARPRDPYGNPVPLHNAGLYVMARWAYRGDYWEAKAEFLNEIGADESADNVLYLEELLRPTFKPSRLDLREPWEQRNPLEARRWLRKSLGDLKRKNGREKRIVLPYEENDEQARSELFAFAEEESERVREAEIRSILPERQYQILMLLAEERKQAEIAELLGIGLSTVKTHAGRLQNNPDLLRALRP